MKKIIALLLFPAVLCIVSYGQGRSYPGIDRLLINGEYRKAVDTCRMILTEDSLNAAVWYKLGMAYRNFQPDDHSLECFIKASECDSANNLYRFSLAKAWLNKDKNHKAKPILIELCSADSLNWDYASYLAGIYMEEGSYGKAQDLYTMFYLQDSSDYVIHDKIGFSKLRQGKFEEAIKIYEKSLAINPKNLNAIRNLSFLYPYVEKTDTAVVLLTGAIDSEKDDVDLYARRGTIYWGRENYKDALDDYMAILQLGDSSFLYLKRAGIANLKRNNLTEAFPLLMKAHFRDTTDYETIDYIAQCYIRKNDFRNTNLYYEKIIAMLKPMAHQLGITHMNNGQAVYLLDDYKKAAENYILCYELTKNINVIMILANIYDENLNNPVRAMQYYRQFLASYRNTSKSIFSDDYITSVRDRLDYLERSQAEQKAKAEFDKNNAAKKEAVTLK